jgi:thioredoxin reductase
MWDPGSSTLQEICDGIATRRERHRGRHCDVAAVAPRFRMTAASPIASAIVIGAGPAGCSCASWLAQQGVGATLIESAPAPAPLLARLDLRQDWVLGNPGVSTAELARRYREHIGVIEDVQLRCGVRIERAESLSGQRKRLRLSDGSVVEGAALVFATGLRPRPHAWTSPGTRPPHDAIDLTVQRAAWRDRRVLLLGGGDNAVENTLYLLEHGNAVVLWSRSALRARPSFQERLAHDGRAVLRLDTPLPAAITPAGDGWHVSSAAHGDERYDEVAVLFGFEPDDGAWEVLRASAAWRAAGWPDLPMSSADEMAHHGLFLAGDASQRLHPCIQTALADGVTASKQVLQWLSTPES